jgi:uncharacterized protein YecT (DUF1311 family)
MRACYSREKVRVNAQIDSLVANIAAEFKRDVKELLARYGQNANAETLERARAKLAQSQRTWQAYREQHCTAIAESYGAGSGAGTAREECEFRLGKERLKELRVAFESSISAAGLRRIKPTPKPL